MTGAIASSMRPRLSSMAPSDRAETVANLLTALKEAGEPVPLLDAPEEIVRAFRGLGFGYLVLDNLYEAADHVRLLDAGAFWADVSAAIEAAGRNDPEYRIHLKAAAEKLLQAREQIHSQTMHWLDFVQIDPKNLCGRVARVPEEWLAGLRRGIGRGLRATRRSKPPSASLNSRAKFPAELPSSVDLCCGAYRERADALLPLESQWWNLLAAQQTTKRLFGVDAAVYARKVSAPSIRSFPAGSSTWGSSTRSWSVRMARSSPPSAQRR